MAYGDDDDDDEHVDSRSANRGGGSVDVEQLMSTLSWRRFVDPNEPWVLVPNGSFAGYFDFVSDAHAQRSSSSRISESLI